MLSIGIGIGFDVGFGGDQGLWTPAQTTNDLWVDFSDTSTITESLNLVSKVDDKSGNNNHLTQSVASSQPLTNTNTINGLNVIKFDGSNDYLSSPIGLGDTYTSYFLVDTTASSRNAMWCEEALSGNSTKNYLYSGPGGSITVEQFPPSGGDAVGNVAAGINLIEVLQTSPGVGQIYANATQIQTLSEVFSGTPRFQFSVGGRLNSNNWFDTDMCEINFRLAVRSLNDRQRMQGYLCWKWGIQSKLPVGHPYKDAPP